MAGPLGACFGAFSNVDMEDLSRRSGVTQMWTRFVSIGLGVWLAASPKVFGYDAAAATNDHIVGPLVAAFSCIAISEATRPIRWMCLPLGLWLLAVPWIFGSALAACVNYTLVGAAIVITSFLGGRVHHSFGGGWTALWQRPQP
jgi:hypothetical protein